MTYGLDTSALVRLLVGQPADIAQKVNARLSGLIAAGHKIHVSRLVLSEAYFALQVYYGLTKDQAISVLSSLLSISGFLLDPSLPEVFATPRLGHASPGFVDRMIISEYADNGEITLSCERSFRKLDKTEILL